MSAWFAAWLALSAAAQQPGPASSQPAPVETPAPSPAEPSSTVPVDPDGGPVEPSPVEPVEQVEGAPAAPPGDAAPEGEPPQPPEATEPGAPGDEPPVEAPVEVLVPPEAAPEPTPADAPAPDDLFEPPQSLVPMESPVPLQEATPSAPEPAPQTAPEVVAPEDIPFAGPPLPVRPQPRSPDADDEPPIIIVPPQGPLQPVRDGLRDALLPELPMRGLRNGVALLLLALASALAASLARRARVPLLDDGVLPAVLRAVETGARILVVFFVFGVLAAWLPASIAPGLPWVVVAVAVAVGWSARDVLPDLVGWLFVSMEGHIRPGQWLDVDGRRGRVERLGMRATRLRDHLGNVIVMPNRLLVRAPVTADVGWPTIEVRLRLDPAYGPARIRSALREAAELSPWAAPCEPEVYREGEAWVVRLDLLDGTFADRLEGTLAERVEEILSR